MTALYIVDLEIIARKRLKSHERRKVTVKFKHNNIPLRLTDMSLDSQKDYIIKKYTSKVKIETHSFEFIMTNIRFSSNVRVN